jgi:hypothetical protein
MPRYNEIALPGGALADCYEIALKQFTQNILSAGDLKAPRRPAGRSEEGQYQGLSKVQES